MSHCINVQVSELLFHVNAGYPDCHAVYSGCILIIIKRKGKSDRSVWSVYNNVITVFKEASILRIHFRKKTPG